MLLYNSQISGNCYKVRLLLAHLGVPYEKRDVDVVDRSDPRDFLAGLNEETISGLRECRPCADFALQRNDPPPPVPKNVGMS